MDLPVHKKERDKRGHGSTTGKQAPELRSRVPYARRIDYKVCTYAIDHVSGSSGRRGLGPLASSWRPESASRLRRFVQNCLAARLHHSVDNACRRDHRQPVERCIYYYYCCTLMRGSTNSAGHPVSRSCDTQKPGQKRREEKTSGGRKEGETEEAGGRRQEVGGTTRRDSLADAAE